MNKITHKRPEEVIWRELSRRGMSKSEMTDTNQLEHLAKTASKFLQFAYDKSRQQSFDPHKTKTLRKFTASEVADFLGVDQNYIRKAHHDKVIEEVEKKGAQRLYSAVEIDAMRRTLAKRARNKDRLIPGRELHPERDLQVITVATFKGGSAKTTTSVNLAQYLALRGYRILFVDLDPQASATGLLGFSPDKEFREEGSIYDALRYEDPIPLQMIIRPTYFHRLDIAPGGLPMAQFESDTADNAFAHPPYYLRLSEALKGVEANYDVVVIDSPPQLGYSTTTALCASTGVIVPIVPQMLDVASAAQFMAMTSALLRSVKKRGGNTDIGFLQFLMTRVDNREYAQQQIISMIRSCLTDQVMAAEFIKSSAVSEAGLRGDTIYDALKSDMNRETYNRLRDAVDSIGKEVEQHIQRTWQRGANG